ncbi:ABC transporter ATP-binding protein [Oscillospiraceae bacterium MB08-C2-2]|nr:ABC transporter ATP-binding protein [Oscillospiraceae bacterium MB08-C2-2]
MESILRTEDLSISFGGLKAVQNLSFSLRRGEILGLIGPNGSGKSTVVNLISGIYRPDAGSIFFEEKQIPYKMSVAERARTGIGRTFQTPQPFGTLTVFENVYTIALQSRNKQEAAAKANEILQSTGLYDLRDIQSSKLPIEKRKWLDLSRILANNPKLIMLDEVLGGLNPSEMEESLQLIQRINREMGMSFLFIEHVMSAVLKICSRCIVLNEGKLLAEGDPSEVLARKDVITAYIGEEME